MRGQDLSGVVLEDRYQIVERIAEGAMGAVYRGTRLSLDRAVAIKVMHTSLPSAMEGRKRFEREAQLMAKLEHPHCVSIIDYGLHAAKPYVVMELVRGRSLFEVMAEQGRFEIPRAVDILRQVLSGLAHAHEQGIIHRDIKPANIMVTPKAPLGLHVRILDFGLARMLEASTSMSNGVAVGTPSYMAPEQCRGETLDARVDIYACGVVLFEMLTGKKPFIAKDPIAIVKKQIDEPPPRLADVAPGEYGNLEAIVARALAKSPADRYPSAVAMAEALDAALSGRASAPPEPTMELTPVRPSTSPPGPSSPSSPSSPSPLSPPSPPSSPSPPSVDVPITVGSSVHTKPARPSSSVRRQLPVSRTRWLILGSLIAGGLAVGAVIMWQLQRASAPSAHDDHATTVVDTPAPVTPTPPPTTAADPATQLVTSATTLASSGKTQQAIDMLLKARRVYPDNAQLAVTLGKLYLNKMWWNDGLSNARDAIKLDPNLRNDPELLKLAVRGFITTPTYDDRLGRFLVELGPPVIPLLEDTAKNHKSPDIRARVESILRKIR